MAGETKAPAFQLYARDWNTSTVTLDLAAQGLFMRLLCHQWIEGPLPPDEHKLARIAGVPVEDFRRIWSDIKCEFSTAATGLVCERLERQRAEQIEYRKTLSERGKKGVVARAAKKQSASLNQASTAPSAPVRSGEPSQSRGKAEVKPKLSTSPASAPSPPISLSDSNAAALPTSPDLQIGDPDGSVTEKPNQGSKSCRSDDSSNASKRNPSGASNNSEEPASDERVRQRKEQRDRLLNARV